MATDVRQNVMATIATNQARGADYNTTGRQLNRQLVDTTFNVVEQAGKVAISAINTDKEKKMQELQNAWEQEKAKGTFDYIDGIKENGEEYSYENVITNSDTWIDNWLEQYGGYLQKTGALKSVVSNYKESLKAGLIEETRNRAYSAIQTYNSENVSALTSVYADFNNYNPDTDVVVAFDDEGYTTVSQLVGIEDYGIGEAAQKYIDAVEEGDTEKTRRAQIDLRLALAARTTGQSTESFTKYRDEIIDSVYRSADLAQFTKGWILNADYGIEAMYKEKGSDSDILDSAYNKFLEELVNKGVELDDGTVLSWWDLSADDISKLKSDFSEYGALTLSKAVAEQETAYAESETYYNNQIVEGHIYMSLQEEVEDRVKSSNGVLSEAYVKKQIPASRVAEYAEREIITKVADAYEVLKDSDNNSTKEQKDDAVSSLQKLGKLSFVQTKLGIGSLTHSKQDDIPLSENQYLQNLEQWMKQTGLDLGRAIVANDGWTSGTSGTSSSSSRGTSSSSSENKPEGLAGQIAGTSDATGDSGATYVLEVAAATTDTQIDAFWQDAKELKEEGLTGDDFKAGMRNRGYEVDDESAPAYYLWNAYGWYSSLNPIEEGDEAKEVFRSITKLEVGTYTDEDAERVNNYEPTVLYTYNKDTFQIGYLLSNTATNDPNVTAAYAVSTLTSVIESYIQNNDYEGFCEYLEAIGSDFKISKYGFASYVPDSKGKVKEDSSSLVSSLLESYKAYTVNTYTNFMAEYKDHEFQLASGTVGKFDDLLEHDVEETLAGFEQTFLKVYKYNNPSWDVSKGYNGIMPSEGTLLTMGKYGSAYNDYCSLLLTAKNETERANILASAQRVLTNDAYKELSSYKSVDLALRASGFEVFSDLGVIDMAKSYLGTSRFSGLLDDTNFTALQSFMVQDADFTSKVEAKLLECQKNTTLNAFGEVYTLVGDEVQKYFREKGPRTNEIKEDMITKATNTDTRADLDSVKDSETVKSNGKVNLSGKQEAINTLWANYFGHLDTYKQQIGYGGDSSEIKGVLKDILNNDGKSYLDEGVNNMLNLVSTIGTSSEVSLPKNAEDLLYLCISLNAWDDEFYSLELNTDNLSSENFATTKYELAVWWSELDDDTQLLVRNTACALANTYSFYKDYSQLELGDEVKYENGKFVSSKFGVIERGGSGFFYTDSDGNKINLTSLSDTTSTQEIVKAVVPESLNGKVVLRGNFSSSTVDAIQTHNKAKSDAEERKTGEMGDQYVLVAIPDCVAKDNEGFVYSGSIFSKYNITEYTLDEITELYGYYARFDTHGDAIIESTLENDNIDFETFKQELSSMLSPSQMEYVEGHYRREDAVTADVELVAGAAPEAPEKEEPIVKPEGKYKEIDSEAFRNAQTFAKEKSKAEIGSVYQYLKSINDEAEFEDAVNGLLYEAENSNYLLDKVDSPEDVINGYADDIRKKKGWGEHTAQEETKPIETVISKYKGKELKTEFIETYLNVYYDDIDTFAEDLKSAIRNGEIVYNDFSVIAGRYKDVDSYIDATVAKVKKNKSKKK